MEDLSVVQQNSVIERIQTSLRCENTPTTATAPSSSIGDTRRRFSRSIAHSAIGSVDGNGTVCCGVHIQTFVCECTRRRVDSVVERNAMLGTMRSVVSSPSTPRTEAQAWLQNTGLSGATLGCDTLVRRLCSFHQEEGTDTDLWFQSSRPTMLDEHRRSQGHSVEVIASPTDAGREATGQHQFG